MRSSHRTQGCGAPMPPVDVSAVFSMLDDPSVITLAPLRHSAEAFSPTRSRAARRLCRAIKRGCHTLAQATRHTTWNSLPALRSQYRRLARARKQPRSSTERRKGCRSYGVGRQNVLCRRGRARLPKRKKTKELCRPTLSTARPVSRHGSSPPCQEESSPATEALGCTAVGTDEL